MNSPVFTQDNLLSTVITPLGDNQLLFKNLQGQEYLSELFHFRPPLVTPRPRIVSTQTAIVTGPAGGEIWTDKYGRIKVQFHWDQVGKYDENSSCWIRVNQGWAGKGWGHLAITDFHAKAGMTLSLKSGMQLTIQAGENFISLDASGITIQGAMVKVNSGGSPGECSPIPPAKPKSPSAPELPSGVPEPTSLKETSPSQLLTAKTLKQVAQEGAPFCEQCLQCNH